MYIHERENWWQFRYDAEQVMYALGHVRMNMGVLYGRLEAIGYEVQRGTMLSTLTTEIAKSSEIEGEILDYQQIRSSVANKLGIPLPDAPVPSHYIDGVVEMMLDATQNFRIPLSDERLFGWHSALFPTGRSGSYPIEAGCYRTGEMQVVSGAMGRERVHYVAPSLERVPQEMERFIQWFNTTSSTDPVIMSALAHLWFVTIHPFDDGNGRIARALADMLLARADGSPMRFYSMSDAILNDRRRYYQVLEMTQSDDGDVTEWLLWYLECLATSVETASRMLSPVFARAEFWKMRTGEDFNQRQRKMINRLFDGIEGKLTSAKWAKMCKCSPDTALNDINDLIRRGILKKSPAGGRSTNYELGVDGVI